MRRTDSTPGRSAHNVDDELHDHDKGLSHDLPRLLDRRRVLGLLGGFGLAGSVAACSSDGTAGSTAASTVGEGEIPAETAGPYPGTAPTGTTCSARAGSCAATSRRASPVPPGRQKGCR